MKNHIQISLVLGVIFATLLFVGLTGAVFATGYNAPDCTNSKSGITGSVNKGRATLVVPAGLCPVKVSFTTYSHAGTIVPFEDQVLDENVTDTYGPGTHHIGPLDLSCNWQADLYFGNKLEHIPATGHGSVLIAYDYKEHQTCDTYPTQYPTPYATPYATPYTTPYATPYPTPSEYPTQYPTPYTTPYATPYATPYPTPYTYPTPVNTYPSPYSYPYPTPIVFNTPPQLYCQPQYQQAPLNAPVNFAAFGGVGNYQWMALGANPHYGTGSEFSTKYSAFGIYTVSVTSGGQVAQCSVNVYQTFQTVSTFDIVKLALNKTLNQTQYVAFVEGQAGDTIEFQIRMKNTGANAAEMRVADVLPVELSYIPGSTSVSGSNVADGIISANGISLGTVQPGQEKVVLFRTTIKSGTGAKVVSNQADGTMSGSTKSAYAAVSIKTGQVLGVADIVTGPGDNVFPWILSLGFAASCAFYLFYFRGMNTFKLLTAVRAPIIPALIVAAPEPKPMRIAPKEDAEIDLGRINPALRKLVKTGGSEFGKMIAQLRNKEIGPDF